MRLKQIAKDTLPSLTDWIALAEAAQARRGGWREWYGRSGPLVVELGMGSGQMLRQLAQTHPENLYLGVDLNEERLYRAQRQAAKLALPNLRFARFDLRQMLDYFAPGEIDELYLTFPDPWPKARHEKYRLTTVAQWQAYRSLVHAEGRLIFKTDNEALFNYSLETLQAAGLTPEWVTFDLHQVKQYSTICQPYILPETSYEERFKRAGKPIFQLVWRAN